MTANLNLGTANVSTDTSIGMKTKGVRIQVGEDKNYSSGVSSRGSGSEEIIVPATVLSDKLQALATVSQTAQPTKSFRRAMDSIAVSMTHRSLMHANRERDDGSVNSDEDDEDNPFIRMLKERVKATHTTTNHDDDSGSNPSPSSHGSDTTTRGTRVTLAVADEAGHTERESVMDSRTVEEQRAEIESWMDTIMYKLNEQEDVLQSLVGGAAVVVAMDAEPVLSSAEYFEVSPQSLQHLDEIKTSFEGSSLQMARVDATGALVKLEMNITEMKNALLKLRQKVHYLFISGVFQPAHVTEEKETTVVVAAAADDLVASSNVATIFMQEIEDLHQQVDRLRFLQREFTAKFVDNIIATSVERCTPKIACFVKIPSKPNAKT